MPPEIAFLAQAGVPPKTLDQAARRAEDLGVGASEVLIAEGLVPEDFYYRALSARLNCPWIDRAAALASGFDYRAALRAGVARADPRKESFDWLLAPRGGQIVELLGLGGGCSEAFSSEVDSGSREENAKDIKPGAPIRSCRIGTGSRGRIAICAPKFFSALARAKGRRALAEDASFALSRADARLSANAPEIRRSTFFGVVLSGVILAGLLAFSPGLLGVSSLLLSALFLGGIYVRACAIAAGLLETLPPAPALSERALPVYTIIAPMYHEAAVAAQFLGALKAIDYPAAKLDIKFVLEAEDFQTGDGPARGWPRAQYGNRRRPAGRPAPSRAR